MPNIFDSLLGTSWEESAVKAAGRRGVAEGSAGRPAADTPKYDVGEAQVRQDVTQRHTAVQQKLVSSLQDVLPKIVKKDGELAQIELEFQSRKSGSDLAQSCEGHLANSILDIESSFLRKHKAEGNYLGFRVTHGINVDPDHPADRLHYISVVFLLLAVEAVANAGFWGMKFGENFLKGIMVAIGLSMLNILAGLVGGISLSYKNLSGLVKKISAFLGFLACIGICAAINIYVIRSRAGGPDGAVINALTFSLGFFFALIAAYKGYRFFGSYPGYEAASGAYLSSLKEIRVKEENLRSSVSGEVRSQEDIRKKCLRSLSDVLVYLAKVKADLENLEGSYKITVKHLGQVLESVVGTYRLQNRASKGALTPSPAWFDDPVEPFSEEHSGLIEAQRRIDQVADRAQMAEGEQRTQSSRELTEIQEIKSTFLGVRIPELLDQCNTNAHRSFLQSLGAVGNQGNGRV